ncbi:MAG: tetratricopeptide repeat protein [Chloroflexota bacterium]
MLVEIALHKRDLVEAEAYCEEAIELSRKIQNRSEEAATLYYFANIHRKQDRLDEAISAANQSLDYFQQMGNLRYQGILQLELARIYRYSENYKLAMAACEKSARIFNDLGDNIALVQILILWGDCYQLLEEMENALQKWNAAKDLAIYLSNSTLVQMIKSRFEGTVL